MGIKNKNLFLMILILIFALALRLIFFTGIDSSDSLGYTKAAFNAANGAPLSEDVGVGTLRLGIVYPTALLYSIFGVNEISSNILVLLISLCFIVLIYKLGKLLFSDKAGLLSAFLLSFFPFDVINSTRLNTDITSAFFVSLAIYYFLKSEKIYYKSSNMLYFFSGLSMGLAYLIKELSLLTALFFAVYFVCNKKIKSNYFFIALGFVLIFCLELFYFLNLTGNPFYRYSFVESSYADAMIAYNNIVGRSSFPIGLFHYPYLIFTDKLMGLFYPFIFIAIVYAVVKRKKETYNLLFWFLPILAYIIFGSLSITRYIPVPANSRFLSLITIPGILIMAFFLSQKAPLIKKILMPSIIALLFITSIMYVYISEDRFSLEDERSAYSYLKLHPKMQVYTDERTLAIFDYISGYKNDKNVKSFHYYDSLKTDSSYIVINRRIINYFILSKANVEIPGEVFSIPKNWVLETKTGRKDTDKIEIYHIR